ncbi:MAG: Rrf2 family transcriptional regulator, partial [Ilumatobacteraceae bacterium]
ARAPETITVADVIRAVEGPLASVRGVRPHELAAAGEQEPFISLWIAVRAALRSVLEHVTLADLAAGELPAAVAALAADPDAWDDRPRGARAVSPTVEARPATPAPAKASVKTKAPAKAPNKRAGGPAR